MEQITNLIPLQAGLERHLKNSRYTYSIINDRIFAKSQSVLDGKARRLRMEGMGKKPHATRPITSAEEELLWAEGLPRSSWLIVTRESHP